MEKENQGIAEAYQYPEIYAKSNILIGAKYRSSLLENKLTAIALSRIQYNEKEKELYARIKATELKHLLKVNPKSGSFYSQLQQTAEMMTGRTIGISDEAKKEFCYISIITKSTYKNGEFYIQFHSDLQNYLYNIRKSFTKLQLSVMLSFDKDFSFRLYEILKSKSFYPKGQEREDNIFRFSIPLSELKLELGIVNAELDEVRKVLRNSKNPDYDKAVEKSPEQKYQSWSEFKRKILEPSIKEINSKSDLFVEYVQQTSGKGGKVFAIEFTVKINSKDKKEEIPKEDKPDYTETEILEMLGQIFLLGQGTITMSDCKVILEKAEYDMEKIKNAFSVMNTNKSDVDNPVGFLLKAIEEGWKQRPKEERRKKIANDFNRMMNSYDDIDFDTFEQQILSNV